MTDSATAYTAHLRVGTHVWDIDTADNPEYGPLADVRFSWLAPQDDGWPTQHEPTELVFGVIVSAGIDFSDVDQGTVVHFTFTPAGYATPLLTFGGTVRDLTGYPHDLGMVYNITAIDHLQKLAEDHSTFVAVTDALVPIGTLWAAVLAGTTPLLPNPWAGQASRPSTFPVTGSTWPAPFNLSGSAWDVWRGVLRNDLERRDALTSALYTPRYQFPVLTYKLDANGDLDAAQPFFGTWCPAGPRNAPLHLTLDGGVWASSGGNVDADQAATAPTTWARERIEPNVVITEGSLGPPIERPHTGDDIVRYRPDPTDINNLYSLANFNPSWVVAGIEDEDQWSSLFEVIASELPAVVDGWLTLPDAMRTLVALHGIDPRHTPDGSGSMLGMLGQASLIIPAGGRWAVQFKLRRTLPDPASTLTGGWDVPGAITWDELPPAVTWNNLDPTLTWDDLNLIGD